MLLIDKRAGSRDLVKPLEKIGIPIYREKDGSLPIIDFGDIAFTGRGEKNTTLDIGIEFKKLGDIVQCCRDGRFSGHQLPGMRKTYDYAWLMIEGDWKQDANGLLTTYRGPGRGWAPIPGKMRASEFEKHILTFELCGGIHVRYTNTRVDSVRAIVNLYRWWTDKALDKHTSHLAIHTPATFGIVQDERKTLMTLPGIGYKTSAEVLKHFGSLGGALVATVGEWMNVEGIGMKTAREIVNYLHGEVK